MFVITTPIPYTNAEPHLGHLLEAVFTDTIARFQRRLQPQQVLLTMGLDQHGLKILEKSRERKLEVHDFIKLESQKFIDLYAQFGISYDVFTQTTSLEHTEVSQLIWKTLYNKNLIYKKTYTGLYCVGCEDFYATPQLTEDGNCPIHGTKPIEMSEENYFFKLSAFQDTILEFLQSAEIAPDHIRKEWLNFTNEGLQDTSISRLKKRMSWGIDVPGDETQVMYVWFEAVINYLTACVNPETIERYIELGRRKDIGNEILEELQQAMPIEIMYISKEIAKFHLVFFVAMLNGLGLDTPLQTLVHGLINDAHGKKFSKSLGNGVLPHELVTKFGIDGTRFILLHEVNVDGDTNFDWKQITEAYNSHLANNIGNLVMRVSNLVEKYLDGFVDLSESKSPFDLAPVYLKLQTLHTREALDCILQAASWGNQLLEEKKPWTLAKEGKDSEVKEVLTQLCSLLKALGESLSIFLPDTGAQIYEVFTSPKISKAEILFPKIENDIP